jgi:hypothetical protein
VAVGDVDDRLRDRSRGLDGKRLGLQILGSVVLIGRLARERPSTFSAVIPDAAKSRCGPVPAQRWLIRSTSPLPGTNVWLDT